VKCSRSEIAVYSEWILWTGMRESVAQNLSRRWKTFIRRWQRHIAHRRRKYSHSHGYFHEFTERPIVCGKRVRTRAALGDLPVWWFSWLQMDPRDAASIISVIATAGLSSRVVSASDCGVRGPRLESRRCQLCLSRQLLWYTVLSTDCAPLLQCLGRLSLPPFVGR